MSDNKTQPTDASVEHFLAAVEHPTRRADGMRLLQLMRDVTSQQPVMWGPTMVGFGSYFYRSQSGRSGDWLAIGFSPRKASLSLYGITMQPEASELLAHLGKHKTGVGCLYINKLADVDEAVLIELIRSGYEYVTTQLDASQQR